MKSDQVAVLALISLSAAFSVSLCLTHFTSAGRVVEGEELLASIENVLDANDVTSSQSEHAAVLAERDALKQKVKLLEDRLAYQKNTMKPAPKCGPRDVSCWSKGRFFTGSVQGTGGRVECVKDMKGMCEDEDEYETASAKKLCLVKVGVYCRKEHTKETDQVFHVGCVAENEELCKGKDAKATPEGRDQTPWGIKVCLAKMGVCCPKQCERGLGSEPEGCLEGCNADTKPLCEKQYGVKSKNYNGGFGDRKANGVFVHSVCETKMAKDCTRLCA